MKIFLIGFMGAGKSYWGAQLSDLAKLPFIDLDQEIEKAEGKTISSLFAELGEEGFRQRESTMLRLLSENQDNFIMACGGGTPCFLNNLEFMKQMGRVVWLHPPLEIILERLRKDFMHRPLIQNLNEDELRQFVLDKMAERSYYYQQAHVTITDYLMDASHILKQIMHD